MKRQFDVVSFVKARRAQQTANIANGDITLLLDAIEALQSQVLSMSNALTAAQTTIDNLSNTYDAHVHGYTDIDQAGTVLNKSTDIPS